MTSYDFPMMSHDVLMISQETFPELPMMRSNLRPITEKCKRSKNSANGNIEKMTFPSKWGSIGQQQIRDCLDLSCFFNGTLLYFGGFNCSQMANELFLMDSNICVDHFWNFQNVHQIWTFTPFSM